MNGIDAMENFIFNTTKSIVAEAGASARMADIAGRLLGNRVLVVTDKGVRGLGLTDAAIASLEAAGIAVAIFDDVAADPPESNILALVEAVMAHEATGILAIGGGSPMDAAKVAALLAGRGKDLADVYGVDIARGPRLPLVLVQQRRTTSKYPIAIVTTGDAEKRGSLATASAGRGGS